MPLKGTIPRPTSLVTFAIDNLQGEKYSNKISYTSMENLVKKSDEVMKGKLSKHDHQIHALKEKYQKQQEEAVLMRSRANCKNVPTMNKSLPPIFNIPPPPPLPPTTLTIPGDLIQQKREKSHLTLNLGNDSLLLIHFISHGNNHPVSNSSDQPMELKVKLQKDGTRNVTRRHSARTNQLKEKELVLTRERTGGMTKHKNAMPEFKVMILSRY